MELQEPSFNTYFGTVNKAVWYQVANSYGVYTIDFVKQTSQKNTTKIIIENRANNVGQQFSEEFQPTPNPSNVVRQIKIVHTPAIKAREYVILNSGN